MQALNDFMREKLQAKLADAESVELRAVEYDGNEETAMSIIDDEYLMGELLDETYRAIKLGQEYGVEVVKICVGNCVFEGQTYPMEYNCSNIYESDTVMGIGGEVISDNAVIEILRSTRALIYYLDRGEYLNCYAEDFAPALAIISQILSENGYTCRSLVKDGGLLGKLVFQIQKRTSNLEIYDEYINVRSANHAAHSVYLIGFDVEL